MFILVFIFIIVVGVFVFAMIFSPKVRGNMMANQVRAMKHMVDVTKDDLSDLATTMSDVSINTQKKVLDKHEDTMRDISTRNAKVRAEGIKVTTSAIREGLTGKSSGTMYCKHCGANIDSDSTFCKSCGQKQ